MAAVEISAARRADIVITHSPVEADILRRHIGFGKVHVVPFTVPPRKLRRPFAERHGLAVLGSFGHPPNSDAVHYLCSDILPFVWARDPTLTCKIVGHGWHSALLAGHDPRVDIVGEVDDLGDVFDMVRLTVAPLRFGAGIKGKVLDSFATGLPCVMAHVAAEGLRLTGELSGLVSDDATTITDLIVRFCTDQHTNEAVGDAALRIISQEFSETRVVKALGDVLAGGRHKPLADDARVASG
jgi:glycosyltransferase involved in cell wall biosynthesis